MTRENPIAGIVIALPDQSGEADKTDIAESSGTTNRMARRDPQDIAADKLAEARSAKMGAGYDGKREIHPSTIKDPGDYRVGVDRDEITVDRNAKEHWFDCIRNLSAGQRKAGDRFRANWEMSGGGRCMGNDFTRERVDVSGYRDTEQVGKADAINFLNHAAQALGNTGFHLCVKICGEGMTIAQAARASGFGGSKYAETYTGRRLRESLGDLATHLGL